MMTELIEILREDHRNIETLLLVLERELNIFDRAEQPHYEVAQAIIDYFRDYLDRCHHPKEDAVFAKLKTCDPAAAASVGDLEAEHLKGAKRLRLVARAVESVLSEQEVLRQTVDDIVRDFIETAHGDGAISHRGQSAAVGRLGGDRCEAHKAIRRSTERTRRSSTRCGSAYCDGSRKARPASRSIEAFRPATQKGPIPFKCEATTTLK